MRSQVLRRQAYQILGLQCLVALLISLGWLLVGAKAALSVWIGALTCIIPNVYFIQRFFHSVRFREPKKIVRVFYWGELIKLALTAVLIALALLKLPVNIAPFLMGVVGVQLGLWLTPFLATNRVAHS